MVTFLSGGTGTPKLLDGASATYSPEETTVVVNTGDDIELGGLMVCPDVDTFLYQGGEVLDRERWWGIKGDSTRTHNALSDIAEAADLDSGPQYLPDEYQTQGRDIAAWRRFSGVDEFMEIGDRDRAVHITRTSLLDQGHSLDDVIDRLADGFGVDHELLPMSNDPVASLVHTGNDVMHFQEFWVGRNGNPAVENVEFRGASSADPAPGVLEALRDDVIIGPSNPVTSIGPLLALDGVPESLQETTVVAVSPFVDDEPFSGPVSKLMEAVGTTPSSAGLRTAYPFADAFVLDEDDETRMGKPTARTDLSIDSSEDAARIVRACEEVLAEVR
ncbi:MAG: LPPG:FO 2-phospho-L-lactate transferase [Halobacteriales archaeon]|jgi:LPPG:FO 2-phospho-L-lactate transferase